MNKMTTAIVLAASAAVAVTGITYASATPEPVAKAAPVVQKAAPMAAPAAVAPAAVAPAAAPALAPLDGGSKGNEGKGNEGRGEERREHREHKRHHRGVIHVNERSYSADDFGCITVVSGLGAKTLNIRNDSHRTVEVFSGAVCDNGAPIATVGPRSSSDGVRPKHLHHHEGIEVKNGVVGSFRVVHHYGEGRGEGGEGYGEGGKR
ncbi:hypothetical protein ACIRRH_17620 [Kitasatospora sp. NPDC101235]|uniref:hypothetical protein n=1 Tax=Kitasatospora sp. NPDC101235 TaxID=3364101 RepID=UPI00380BA01D